MQSSHSNIFKWFISPHSSWLLRLTGPEAGMLIVASSLSSCCTENPLQAQPLILEMNDSSQMWSMKCSLLVFVYIKPSSCLMSQNPNKLATSSNKLSSLGTLDWCEESRPVQPRRQTDEAGRSFLTVCAQKCNTQCESSSGMSWVLPLHFAGVISTIL